MVQIWKYNAGDDRYEINPAGSANSLDEGSQFFPGGIYTTFRTYQHEKALRLDDHFLRLEQSARLQERHLSINREILRAALREILNKFPNGDIRLRIHCAFEEKSITTYIMAEPFINLPESLYESGAAAETIELQRENPESKATSFIDQTRSLRKAKPKDVNEYLMIGKDGTLLEGMSSNIFVLANSEIWTASDDILPGITRSVVLDVLKKLDITIRFSGFPFSELHNASEIFITSASRGVLPVTRINSQAIGNGLPGDITRQVRINYEKWLQSELRSI